VLLFAAMAVRLLALVVFLCVAAVVFWFALVHTVHRGTLAVPDLRGSTLDEARTSAHDLGMEVRLEEPGVYSVSVPLGAIADQRPHAGFQVKSGAVVTVRLSLGSERVTVPDIRGESLQGAQRALEQAGLKLGGRFAVDGQGGPDQVIAGGPPTGTEVPPDSEVNLLVNVTPYRPIWVMPSLLSHSLDSIRRFCADNGLRIGQIHEVAYPGLAPGVVLRQYPAAGSPLSRSDIIAVWVSR
jgi:beta-lactam-binding protein with PASTA domain